MCGLKRLSPRLPESELQRGVLSWPHRAPHRVRRPPHGGGPHVPGVQALSVPLLSSPFSHAGYTTHVTLLESQRAQSPTYLQPLDTGKASSSEPGMAKRQAVLLPKFRVLSKYKDTCRDMSVYSLCFSPPHRLGHWFPKKALPHFI